MAYFCMRLLRWDEKVAIMIYEIPSISMEVLTMISRWVSLVVCLSLLAIMCPASVWADSLVVENSGFEYVDNGDPNQISDWTLSKGHVGERSSTYAHDGSSYSFRFTSTSGGVSEYYQMIDLSGRNEQSLTVKGYLLYSGGTLTGDPKLEARVIESSVECTSEGVRTPIALGENIGGTETWQEFSDSVTVPAEGEYKLCLYLVGEENTLYYDDISVEAPGATAVRVQDISGYSEGGRLYAGLLLLVSVILVADVPRRIRSVSGRG
jgi:hypothetical protein